MKKFMVAALLLGVLSTASTATVASPYIKTKGPTTPPVGHVRYCESNPDDCQPMKDTGPVRLTLKLWRELRDINFTANGMIKPVTDFDNYGVTEKWIIPTSKGDCEDYVLLKRRMLHEAGWPMSALLITVVRDQNGDGHAVLSVRTDRGDLILDNQASYAKTWDQTPYRYIKRQSASHAGRWRKINNNKKRKRIDDATTPVKGKGNILPVAKPTISTPVAAARIPLRKPTT